MAVEIAPKRLSKAMTAIYFLSISIQNIFSTKLPVLFNAGLNQRTSVGFLYASLLSIFLEGLFYFFACPFQRMSINLYQPTFSGPMV